MSRHAYAQLLSSPQFDQIRNTLATHVFGGIAVPETVRATGLTMGAVPANSQLGAVGVGMSLLGGAVTMFADPLGFLRGSQSLTNDNALTIGAPPFGSHSQLHSTDIAMTHQPPGIYRVAFGKLKGTSILTKHFDTSPQLEFLRGEEIFQQLSIALEDTIRNAGCDEMDKGKKASEAARAAMRELLGGIHLARVPAEDLAEFAAQIGEAARAAVEQQRDSKQPLCHHKLKDEIKRDPVVKRASKWLHFKHNPKDSKAHPSRPISTIYAGQDSKHEGTAHNHMHDHSPHRDTAAA